MNKEEVLNVFLLADIPEIITQEEFDNVQIAIKELLAENQELKKQLEEKENQQKEFMEWLESESHRLSGDILLNSSFIEVRTILLKYKEIIGADNEN